MAELYQVNDRICLDFGSEKRDVLFALETANWAAEMLEEFAGKVCVAKPGLYCKDSTVEVEGIINRKVPQIRLKFGHWADKHYLGSIQAINLAKLLRVAVEKFKNYLKWTEERDPQALLR